MLREKESCPILAPSCTCVDCNIRIWFVSCFDTRCQGSPIHSRTLAPLFQSIIFYYFPARCPREILLFFKNSNIFRFLLRSPAKLTNSIFWHFFFLHTAVMSNHFNHHRHPHQNNLPSVSSKTSAFYLGNNVCDVLLIYHNDAAKRLDLYETRICSQDDSYWQTIFLRLDFNDTLKTNPSISKLSTSEFSRQSCSKQ